VCVCARGADAAQGCSVAETLERMAGPLGAFRELQYVTLLGGRVAAHGAGADEDEDGVDEGAVAARWADACPTLRTIVLPQGKIWFKKAERRWKLLEDAETTSAGGRSFVRSRRSYSSCSMALTRAQDVFVCASCYMCMGVRRNCGARVLVRTAPPLSVGGSSLSSLGSWEPGIPRIQKALRNPPPLRSSSRLRPPPFRQVLASPMSESKRGPYAGDTKKLLVAVDIGTTFTAVSFSILEPGEPPQFHEVRRHRALRDSRCDSRLL
jgi:hypothetical protein